MHSTANKNVKANSHKIFHSLIHKKKLSNWFFTFYGVYFLTHHIA